MALLAIVLTGVKPQQHLMVVLLPETLRFNHPRPGALERHGAEREGLGARPPFPAPTSPPHPPGAANTAAGSSLGARAPFLRKLRETTEGEKQSSTDSWARCELHCETRLLGTDGSTGS